MQSENIEEVEGEQVMNTETSEQPVGQSVQSGRIIQMFLIGRQ